MDQNGQATAQKISDDASQATSVKQGSLPAQNSAVGPSSVGAQIQANGGTISNGTSQNDTASQQK